MKHIGQSLSKEEVKKYQVWCEVNCYKEDKISKLRFIAEVIGNEDAKKAVEMLDKGELKEEDIAFFEEEPLTDEEYIIALEKIYTGLAMFVGKEMLNMNNPFNDLNDNQKVAVAKAFQKTDNMQLTKMLLKLNMGMIFTLGL